MKKYSFIGFLTVCLSVLFFTRCNQPAPPAPEPADNSATAAAAIQEADIAWSKTATAKDSNAFVAFFVDDASFLGPNEPVVTGKENISKTAAAMFSMPGFSVQWQPTKAEAGMSGDMGYSIGTYTMTVNDAKGKTVTDNGKYLTAWEKQSDGSWKVAADMFNSDMPLAPAGK